MFLYNKKKKRITWLLCVDLKIFYLVHILERGNFFEGRYFVLIYYSFMLQLRTRF